MTKKIIPVPKSIRKDLTGRTFGRLTVLGYVGQDAIHNAQWLCQCECGQTKTYICSRLLRKINPVRSCGCGSRESAKKHGMVKAPEYNAWRSMYQRCNNPNSPEYHNYGGRGIKVCSRWRESFDNFYADMGPRPSPQHSMIALTLTAITSPIIADGPPLCSNRTTKTITALLPTEGKLALWLNGQELRVSPKAVCAGVLIMAGQ